MALPQLHWRKLPVQTPASSDVHVVLEAIADAFAATVYANGADRTAPGLPTVWTFNTEVDVDTMSVYGTPPAAALSDVRVIIAADEAGAPTPTMAAPDTFAVERILVSVAKGAGAYTEWDNANPFTTGNFFGYWRGGNLSALTVTHLHCFESEEAIAVGMRMSDDTVRGFFAGAIIDPGSDDPLDSEVSERLVGVLTGGDNAISTTMFQDGVSAFGHVGDTAGDPHAAVFVPGAGGLRVLSRVSPVATITALNLISHGGREAGISMHYEGNTRYMGRLREVFAWHHDLLGTTYQLSGTDIGYAFGGGGAAAADAVFLRY